jgi:hypothetical protein
MKPKFSTRVRVALYRLRKLVLVCLVAVSGGSHASLVTVDATFTSFTSWMFDPSVRLDYVNGVQLTSSGVVVGNNGAIDYFQSNPVIFSGAVSALDFTYDPSLSFHPLPNALEFFPNSADAVAGEDFTWGTVRFTNGQWFPEADIGVRLTSHSTDAALDGHVMSGVLHLTTVESTTGDPYDEADYLYLVGRPDLGSIRVFDLLFQPPGDPGNVGNFDLRGHIGSLIPTEWVSVGPGGFTNPSVVPQLSAVPAPATLGLIAVGLAGLGFAQRRAS